jgi:hypothetical protein
MMTSDDVLERLAWLMATRGVPKHIRSDNGPEFTAKVVREWLGRVGVKTLFIEPGSPWENGYVESFNGKLRDELLNDVILRDRDFNVGAWGAPGDGTCELRTYYAQNWRGDVVATLDSTGARRETSRYPTYGLPFGIASGDVDGSGSVVAGDASAVNAQIGKSYGQSATLCCWMSTSMAMSMSTTTTSPTASRG